MFNKNTSTASEILRKVYEDFYDNEMDEVRSWGGGITVAKLSDIWSKYSKGKSLSEFEQNHIDEGEKRIEWFEKTNKLDNESVLSTLIEVSKKTIDHELNPKKEGWFSKFRK